MLSFKFFSTLVSFLGSFAQQEQGTCGTARYELTVPVYHSTCNTAQACKAATTLLYERNLQFYRVKKSKRPVSAFIAPREIREGGLIGLRTFFENN